MPPREPSKPKSKKLWAGIIAAAVVIILAAGFGVRALFHPTSDSEALSPADFETLKSGEVAKTIEVPGNIESEKTTTLTTTLTSPIQSVDVKVGDRVTAGQVLATIDVTAAQKELDSRQEDIAAGAETAAKQVSDAQTQLQQYKDSLSKGLNGEINGAKIGLRNAEEQYEAAVRDYNAKKLARDTNESPQLVSQEKALDGARQALLSAAIGAANAGAASAAIELNDNQKGNKSLKDTIDNPVPQAEIATHLGTVSATAALITAIKNVDQQQKAFSHALQEVDSELADAQRKVAATFAAKTDAAVALEAAKLNATHHVSTLEQAVDQAQETARSTQSKATRGLDKLRQDVSSGIVRAPFSGLVTAVAAQPGNNAAGNLVTIADDKKLAVRINIKESDVAKLKLGQKAVITTPGTGAKEFTGELTDISPVANGAGQAKTGGASGAPNGPSVNEKPTFPVTVAITGDTDGLRIGATADIKITLENADNVLSVTRDSLITEGSKKYILIVPKDGPQTLTKVEVTTGVDNGFSVQVTSPDIHPGDRVLHQAARRQSLVGTTVNVGGSAPTEGSN